MRSDDREIQPEQFVATDHVVAEHVGVLVGAVVEEARVALPDDVVLVVGVVEIHDIDAVVVSTRQACLCVEENVARHKVAAPGRAGQPDARFAAQRELVVGVAETVGPNREVVVVSVGHVDGAGGRALRELVLELQVVVYDGVLGLRVDAACHCDGAGLGRKARCLIELHVEVVLIKVVFARRAVRGTVHADAMDALYLVLIQEGDIEGVLLDGLVVVHGVGAERVEADTVVKVFPVRDHVVSIGKLTESDAQLVCFQHVNALPAIVDKGATHHVHNHRRLGEDALLYDLIELGSGDI